jgi:hypothetical protein
MRIQNKAVLKKHIREYLNDSQSMDLLKNKDYCIVQFSDQNVDNKENYLSLLHKTEITSKVNLIYIYNKAGLCYTK